MPFEVTDEVMWDVRRASSVVASRFAGKFDPGDVAQAIYLDILTNNTSYEKAAIKGNAVLFAAYKRAGARHCHIERMRYLHFSDQHMYSTEEIKILLPEYLATLGDVTDLEDARVGVDGLVIPYMDLDIAYSSLRAGQKRTLAKKYYEEKPLTRSEQNMHGKAVKTLTKYTNNNVNKRLGAQKYHDGPRVGNRPQNFPEEYQGYQVDAVNQLQSVLESMY